MVGLTKDIMVLHSMKTSINPQLNRNNTLSSQVCWHQAHLSWAVFQLIDEYLPRPKDFPIHLSTLPGLIPRQHSCEMIASRTISTGNWSSSLVPSQIYPKTTLSKRTFTYPQWIIDIFASLPDWDFPTIFHQFVPYQLQGTWSKIHLQKSLCPF